MSVSLFNFRFFQFHSARNEIEKIRNEIEKKNVLTNIIYNKLQQFLYIYNIDR